MQKEQHEIPRYKKKKPQVSSASKHADHKHDYVKSISVFQHSVPQFNKSWNSNAWTLTWSLWGRFKGFLNGVFFSGINDVVLYKKTAAGENEALTIWELTQKFPGTPIYTNTEDQYAFPQERVV